MVKPLFGLFTVLLVMAGCAEPQLENKSFTGMRQAEIRSMLGEPDAIEVRHKHSDHVWGPMEDLWAGLSPGGRIVIWTYSGETGRKQLYFLNDSDKVAGEFFWHRDADRNPVF